MGAPDFEQWGHGYWPRVTDDDDVRAMLPANLEVLQLGCVQPLHMQQLLQLSKLHTLAVERAVDLTCEQLQQLQEMDVAHGGSLTNLQLRYCATQCPARTLQDARRSGDDVCKVLTSHASHWSALPLRRLSIDSIVYHFKDGGHHGYGYQQNSRTQLDRFNAGPLPADVLSHMVKLTGLTYLGLKCDLPRDFGVTLVQLKGLQELRLARGFNKSEYVLEQQCDESDMDMEGFVEEQLQLEQQEDLQDLLYAAAQLPALRHLVLKRLCECMTPAAVEHLAKAAQLQRMELWQDSPVSPAEMQGVLAAGACKSCVVVDMPLEEGQQLEV
jgi:hypothetical protein